MSRVANAAAEAAWTDWAPFDRALDVERQRGSSEDEVHLFLDTLGHLGLIQLRRQEDGRLWFRMRQDAAERMRQDAPQHLRERLLGRTVARTHAAD